MNASTTNSTPIPPAKKRVIRRKKKQLTAKQKLVKESAEQRFKTEKLVFVWQEKLFSQPRIPANTLQCAVAYLQPKTYKEVVEERVVQSWCGYPLCDDAPKLQELQKFKISLSRRKVYDQSELANYCSDACYHKSKYYALQLSDEPVWYRDFNRASTAHVILKDEDFEAAVHQERKKTQIQKSGQEVRDEYVQHLLGNIPKNVDGELQVIEKTTEAPPMALFNSQTDVYDTIEGYRIEIKRDGKTPTTMVLNKKSEQQELMQQKHTVESDDGIDPEDPDALFETMMMLKDMNMDKDSTPNARVNKDRVELKTVEALSTLKDETKPAPAPAPAQPKQAVTPSKSTVKPALKQAVKEQDEQDANVIKVTTPSAQKQKKPAKKKKKVPELSLFGTIWTMLDHMTTKATRMYLNELQNNHQRADVGHLLASENVLMDEAAYLRGQIFSERILDTYGIIRAQLDIKENLEDDIVNVIRTFKLSDASMVALNPAQCYMMALVLIKSLADIVSTDSNWKLQFENCCKTVDQSTDMVDACVRVLKVASV
ncbi:Rtr1/RPAP2 family-domain-containing protein [Parasitella parasitica]|nr:Rtr1/RPAP2 family-domain-containing protein [Parasitella parasitica]